MKKFIRFYILTVRRDLGLLALTSAGFIFLMDLLLKKIPAPNEFFYAEIEFPTELDAKTFIPPKYLGREITFK